jgi:hypothetical protein
MNDLERLFATFKRSAFRLETLDEYHVDAEEERDFQRFVHGVPLPQTANAEWADEVKELTSSGKQIIRVRLLPEQVNPYLRFELEWGYPYSAAAGEDIRFLPRKKATQLVGDNKTLVDFWLFDDAEAVILNYNPDATSVDVELVSAGEYLSKLVATSQLVKEAAMPWATFYHHLRTLPLHVNLAY